MRLDQFFPFQWMIKSLTATLIITAIGELKKVSRVVAITER